MIQFNAIWKNQEKLLLAILVVALLVRLLFLFWGAELYFNRPSIFVDGDTGAWQKGFENLLQYGFYTNNLNNDLGFFARLPGYSFFMGFFYLLTGQNWARAFPIIGGIQILLDVIAVLLVFKIATVLANRKTGLLAALLYAFYPFIIVWNLVAYSESVSIFLMLAGFWLFIAGEKASWKNLLSGVLLGLGVLMRPQILVLVPVLGFFLLFQQGFSKRFFQRGILLGLGLMLSYGWWPARNYFKYDHLVLTQDLRGLEGNWDEDVIAFMQFTFSLKSEWEPQFSSILRNQPTSWPAEAFTSREDSLLLERAVYLSKHCSSGFSAWKGYWKERVPLEESCGEEIAEIFTYLRERQIQENPWNFYVKVPLQNLRKALFKSKLQYETATGFASGLSNILFRYRTLMILLGLIGSVAMIRKKNFYGLIFSGYFILLYFLLCAGTSVQMRNIEIRYFLHADVLLLIPAAWLIAEITEKFRKPKSGEKPT